MSNYLYVIIFFVVMVYTMIREIYLFFKGKYNPYLFRKVKASNKRRLFNAGLAIAVYWSLNNLLFNTKPPIFIVQLSFIVFSLCFTLGINVLNYLSYVKTRDHKIIYQTVIFNICVIVFCLYVSR